MAGDELENHEAKPGTAGEAGVHEPEGGRGRGLAEADGPADEAVAAEPNGKIKVAVDGIDANGKSYRVGRLIFVALEWCELPSRCRTDVLS